MKLFLWPICDIPQFMQPMTVNRFPTPGLGFGTSLAHVLQPSAHLLWAQMLC